MHHAFQEQEYQDFLVLLELLKSYKIKPLFVMQDLHPYVFAKNRDEMTAIITAIKSKIQENNYGYLDMWSYKKEDYEIGTLIDIVHSGELGWVKINQKIADFQDFKFGDQSAFVVYMKLDIRKEFLHHYQIVLKENIPNLSKILKDEEEHEEELIKMIDEEKLQYVGSMVLGLNDALVEFTGSLAGWTFAMQNNKLILLAGIITGISATLSMASSEYLSAKNEGEENPLKSCVPISNDAASSIFLISKVSGKYQRYLRSKTFDTPGIAIR